MKLSKGIFAAFALCLGSAHVAIAEDTTWNFSTTGDTHYGSGNYDGNTITQNKTDNSVIVTAWSDTREADNPDTVQNATVASNSHGLLNYNRNSGDSHAIDGFNDTDMLLFTFDEAVSLTNINLGWAYDNGNYGYADISILAFNTLPTLAGQTWEQVKDVSASIINLGNVGVGGHALTGVATEAKYWLIGAYNSVFGSADGAIGGNDKFKILALTTHASEPTGEVPTPATGALLAVLLAVIMYRRRVV
ncbi:exosortase-dependent surface protein XDP1 [Alteromonas sp. ASW11-130]|uniref:exosortase-dependent surface protein XDP1 n=1 Tax=Alteromonas sp. ASW11-130 TaxID=3015775 RepID=UPI00224257D5|nr:exosortase-dependent surface protein XDP1 [Alteromonas sp. ASW11-130]MCW8093031.1 hypothetical protein [Alteromonas sp. ASW11-130]